MRDNLTHRTELRIVGKLAHCPLRFNAIERAINARSPAVLNRAPLGERFAGKVHAYPRAHRGAADWEKSFASFRNGRDDHLLGEETKFR
jgi:hypothetical protein